MADTVVGRPRAVAGPEVLSSGGKKFTIVLDNGSTVVTFSEACKDAVNAHLDEELTFEVQLADKPGMAPKVEKVLLGTQVLWEPRSGGGGRQWVDTTPQENARRAVGCAFAYLADENAARVAAGKPAIEPGDLVVRMTELSQSALEQMLDLVKHQGA